MLFTELIKHRKFKVYNAIKEIHTYILEEMGSLCDIRPAEDM